MEVQEVKSIQVVSTRHLSVSTGDEEDDVVSAISPRHRLVITSDLQDYGVKWGKWWGSVVGGLPRRTSNDRCNKCPACKNSKSCDKLDSNRCFGCTKLSTCWGRLACEKWGEEEQAYYYARFSLQAYANPSDHHRLEFIT